MDYEKKYNEALERARALRREAIEKDYVEDYVKDYETIFPELRDSEDERVRKVLINIVKGACDKYGIKYRGDDITEEKLLAYLEKQKEQKPAPISCGHENGTEWSEEDERNRDRAIFYTGFYQRNEGTTKGSEECIDWLKSLRPVSKESLQSRWKPSEEQEEPEYYQHFDPDC